MLVQWSYLDSCTPLWNINQLENRTQNDH